MITQRGARPGSTGVRASFRFGESKSREGPAGKQIRQPTRLLLCRAEVSNRVDAQTHSSFQGDSKGLVDLADLLDRDA
jgi:hypothetical protein